MTGNATIQDGAAAAADEVLEGDFSEEGAGGDVPIPDDLLDEGSGSPRYPLPTELVQYQYPALPVQTVAQPFALTERIVVAVPAAPNGAPLHELGAYESVAAGLEAQFPLRVARLRDLYAACRLAEERKSALLGQRERERMTLNWRNDVNNRQIDDDLKDLRAWWEKTRDQYHADLREAQDALIRYKMSRQGDIEEARAAYWEVRARCAKARDQRQLDLQKAADAAAAEKAVRDREARDQALKVDEKLIAERQTRRVELRDEAAEAERLAAEVEAAAHAAEDDAITRRAAMNTTAWSEYQRVLGETHARIEAEGEELRAAAEQAEAELLEERGRRESWLHGVRQEAVAEGRRRELEAHEARRDVAEAAARAGLTPDEAEAGGHRTALRDLLTEEVAAEGTATEHLALEESKPEPKWRVWLRQTGDALALVGLGGVFGASLGLLLGLVAFDAESMAQGGAWYLAGFWALGVVLYRVMALVSHRAAAYASEELHAPNRTPWRATFAVLSVASVLVGMIGLEACVERYGLVDSVLERQRMETGEAKELTSGQQTAYWAIALIFATPFVLYHAYHGATETRNRLGVRRRREALARQQYRAATDPRMHPVAEAQGLFGAARQRLDATEEDYAAARAEAERRIAEIDGLLQEHPAVVRWNEFVASRDTLLAEDPLLHQARSDWDRAQEAHRTDPAAMAARRRAEEARAAAAEARRRADFAESELVNAMRNAGHAILTSTGVGLAHALGDRAGDFVDGAADAMRAAGSGGAAPVVSSLREAVLSYSSGRQTETWEEAMARERWDSLRNAIYQDPQVRFHRARIASLRTAIHGLDTQYGKRRKQLVEQKRAIELRLAASEESNRTSAYIENAINEEDLNAKAAKLAFDEEFVRLKELAESPQLFRWYVAWMQRRASRAALRRQLQAVQSARLLPARAADATAA